MIEIDGKEYILLKLVYEVRGDAWGIAGDFDSEEEAREYREKFFPGKNFPPIRAKLVAVEPDEFRAIAVLLQKT